MENIKYIDNKASDEYGYVMYRSYEDNVHVLMGSYTDKSQRGRGVFKKQFEKFMNESVKEGDQVYIALTNKKILPYLLKVGFVQISEPIRHWGKINNGINLKLIKT